MVRISFLLIGFFIFSSGFSQMREEKNLQPINSIQSLVDSIVYYGEIHGPYVAGVTSKSKSHKLFQKLTRNFQIEELLPLSSHCNPTVRGYAFWALSRVHYKQLDSVLIAHARDEEMVRVIQGRIISELPVIDFMQWVVHPDLLDADSKKLPEKVIDSVAKVRFLKNF